MAIWIQSLSWTLIYSLAQGFAVYAALWVVFKVVPAASANARYHLSLSALTILLAWFVATWWQQFQSLALVNHQALAAHATGITVIWLPLQHVSVTNGLSNLQSLQASLNAFSPWLSAFYVTGLALMLARLSAGMFQLFSLRNSGTFQPDAALNELLEAQIKRIHLNSPVKLLISAKAQVPMVVGFLKPVILMPLAAIGQLDTAQLETILLHELAHIKRHDYLINILQTIVETILFFNPFVWAISAITRREREYSCDDLVIDHTTETVSYATALAALASGRQSVPLIVVAATGQSTHLFNRIQRIMEMKKNTFSYSRMVATIIIITTITCSIAWVKPTFSKVKKSKAVVETASKPVAPKAVDTETPEEKKYDLTEVTTLKKAIEKQEVNTNLPDKRKDNPGTAIDNKKTPDIQVTNPPISEENTLMYRLMADRLVDQVKGFVVEKKQNQLYINGLLMKDQVASKYLLDLKKELIRIQVFSFDERSRMHPDASFIQLLLPATMSSGCIDTNPKKEGC